MIGAETVVDPVDLIKRLRADADRWMSGDFGRDNEEAGFLSHDAAETIARLMHVIDRDRYVVAAGIVEITNSIRARRWICEGRGPYEWDDDEYQKEFGAALDEVETVLGILGIISFDKTDCTRDEKLVAEARAAGIELVRQWKTRKAERMRPMLASDIGLEVIDPRDAEIARLKAQVAYLSRVSMSKILPDLLNEEETTALVDFVGHLRSQKDKSDV